jgi:hypothetical protein
MRFSAAAFICFFLLLSACEDDPIIGPGGGDDTGGGSYGVIHFSTRPDARHDAGAANAGAANAAAIIDSVSNTPDDPARAATRESIPDNPKRF